MKLCIFRIFSFIIYLRHHLLLNQCPYTHSELNVWHYPVQHIRRWCGCTALGQYSQKEIHRYQDCLLWKQPIPLRSKRQLCCASYWHLHKKIKKLVHVLHLGRYFEILIRDVGSSKLILKFSFSFHSDQNTNFAIANFLNSTGRNENVWNAKYGSDICHQVSHVSRILSPCLSLNSELMALSNGYETLEHSGRKSSSSIVQIISPASPWFNA